MSFVVDAQQFSKTPETRLGIRGGFNMSDISSVKGLDAMNGLAFYDQGEYVGFATSKPFKYGFNAGLVYQIQLSDNVWLEPSVLYTTKGYQLEDKEITIDVNAHYLAVPLVAIYKYELSDNFRLLCQGGLYGGVGVGGYSYFKDAYGENENPRDYRRPTENPRTYDHTVHWKTNFFADEDRTFENKETYRFEGGVQLGVGFELYRFQLVMTYQIGLSPLYNYEADFRSRYRDVHNYTNYNSFNYLGLEVPKAPRQNVLSLSLVYFLDGFKLLN